MSDDRPLTPRLQQVLEFPLVSGIFGRRSRRFGFGMTIPSGPLAYTSQHEPLPLCELEPALLLAAGTGVTGWNFGIPFTVNRSDALSNYSLRMTWRTLPSAATIGASELFFTDDSGIYVARTRAIPSERLSELTGGQDDVARMLAHTRAATVQLRKERLFLPRETPHYDERTLWNGNQPGTTLFLPIGDVGQQLFALLAMYVSNGYTLYDDYKGCLGGELDPFVRRGLFKIRHSCVFHSPTLNRRHTQRSRWILHQSGKTLC